MSASLCLARASRTSWSAAALIRRISSPACEAILPARLNSAKRSFLGRAVESVGGKAIDFTPRGLFRARARGPTRTPASKLASVRSGSSR
jgi:hypothetical protein